MSAADAAASRGAAAMATPTSGRCQSWGIVDAIAHLQLHTLMHGNSWKVRQQAHMTKPDSDHDDTVAATPLLPCAIIVDTAVHCYCSWTAQRPHCLELLPRSETLQHTARGDASAVIDVLDQDSAAAQAPNSPDGTLSSEQGWSVAHRTDV